MLEKPTLQGNRGASLRSTAVVLSLKKLFASRILIELPESKRKLPLAAPTYLVWSAL